MFRAGPHQEPGLIMTRHNVRIQTPVTLDAATIMVSGKYPGD